MMPNTKQVEVKTIAERPPMYHPPLPMEMQLTDVEFEVLTPTKMKEYVADVEANKAPAKPYYTLTTKQYENLALNMGEIKRYTSNILGIVKFYREYDDPKETEK
tara:strand:- start:114 stop:425 length:312 start_codon:yes stop_codon:yes gene_type:complete